MAQTLAAGNPVFEEITTRYSNGSTQTEARQITPDKASNTVTTSKTINLRNTVGQEQVVNVATTTGQVTNHNITISLPDGATETETKTELNQGEKDTVQRDDHPTRRQRQDVRRDHHHRRQQGDDRRDLHRPRRVQHPRRLGRHGPRRVEPEHERHDDLSRRHVNDVELQHVRPPAHPAALNGREITDG